MILNQFTLKSIITLSKEKRGDSVKVITCDYLEVEIPIIEFYCNAYWCWDEDDFVYYQEGSKAHYLTLDYVMRSVKHNDRI